MKTFISAESWKSVLCRTQILPHFSSFHILPYLRSFRFKAIPSKLPYLVVVFLCFPQGWRYFNFDRKFTPLIYTLAMTKLSTNTNLIAPSFQQEKKTRVALGRNQNPSQS